MATSSLQDPPAPMPSIVRAASILWIIAGSLSLAAVIVGLAVIATIPHGTLPWLEGRGSTWMPLAGWGRGVALLLVIAVLGGVFIRHGILMLRGAIADTLQMGVASVVLGCLSLAARSGGGNTGDYTVGAALLVAGVLALTGRPEYLAWRRSHREST